jgi:hypothetical protein
MLDSATIKFSLSATTGKGCRALAGVAREGATFLYKAIIPIKGDSSVTRQLVESPAAAMVHTAAGGSKAGTAEGAGTSEAQSHFRFTRANISAVGFPQKTWV